MLRIRPEQSQCFQQVAEATFVAEVVDYLKRTHTDQIVHLPDRSATVAQLPIEVLSDMVRSGLARAREYGISWRSTLIAFVVLTFTSAPNFDEHPLIQRVLKDEQVEPNLRIDDLWDRTTEENWEAVEHNYNTTAWKL